MTETNGSGAAESTRLDRRALEIINEVARIAVEDLELRPMLQRITDAIARKFSWEFAACVSIDAEQRRFICEAVTSSRPTLVEVGYGRDLGSGVVGHVAATGVPLVLDDVSTFDGYVETMPGTRSEACVPVWHGRRLVAILNLESTREAAFRGSEPVLSTLAEQVAGAIASARLYDEVRRRALLMEMLSNALRIAVEAPDLRASLANVASYVRGRLDLPMVSVILATEDATEFELAAMASSDEVPAGSAPGTRWPVTKGVVGRAIRTGRMQLVHDVSSDPDFINVNPGVVAELVVPIRFRGELLGAFNLESREASLFTADRIQAVIALAEQLAGAMYLAAVNERLAAASRLVEEKSRALMEANRHLERLSTLDSLTGVANRRHFDAAFHLEWRRSCRTGTAISIAMIDVDFFKSYNDHYGHRAGDVCLARIAGAMKTGTQRAGDLVARYGGEEFALVLAAAQLPEVMVHVEQLRAAVQQMAIEHERSPFGIVTISAGVACCIPASVADRDALLVSADRALYRAKNKGRNRVCAAGDALL